MRKVISGLFISLDGVVEAPERWHFPYFNEEMGQAVGGQMASSDTMLLGRKTYEEFAAYWTGKTSADEPFADAMNNTPKIVVSKTLQSADWTNSTLINDNVAEQLGKLKEQPGKNISISGSPTLVRFLLREGILDELRLLVHPIVVGAGIQLFDDFVGQKALKLVDSTTFTTGVVYLTYEAA